MQFCSVVGRDVITIAKVIKLHAEPWPVHVSAMSKTRSFPDSMDALGAMPD
jgi:hypothetical protein